MSFFYKNTGRRGFLLYIVVTVLLALAILAFALNTLKHGTVTQLARNVDQNRLTILAQSANNETIAMLKSKINEDRGSKFFGYFRLPFKEFEQKKPVLPWHQVLFNNFVPEKTLKLAESVGYKLDIKTKAVLTVYQEAKASSVAAFNGYLDIYSQAFRKGKEKIKIEVHERRDVKMVDLRHRFDKYALYVKNYSPDYNNVHRRLVVSGITPSGPDISKIYLGNFNYVKSSDPDKNIYLDLYFKEHGSLPGFRKIFNISETEAVNNILKKFPEDTPNQPNQPNAMPVNNPKILFHSRSVDFKTIRGPLPDDFPQVLAVKKVYERFVNAAAFGSTGNGQKIRLGDELFQGCKNAMSNSNSNAISFKVCNDFVNNANAPARDYKKCAVFIDILNTCISKWKYHYGYTDAASIWKIEGAWKRNDFPVPRSWANALAYRGLATESVEFKELGPYFYQMLETKNNAPFNPEKSHVGIMPLLYGPDGDIKTLIEGPVYLRFFKKAYFDTFSTTVSYGSGGGIITMTVDPEPVPIFYRREDKTKTFQNKLAFLQNGSPRIGFSPNPSVYSDLSLMSKPMTSVSINALWANEISYYDGVGQPAQLNPLVSPPPVFNEPIQKSKTNPAAGYLFGRRIDFPTITWNFANSQKFLASRVRNGVLYLDGIMYIESGDLDLSQVSSYAGKGLIYLARGNCLLGNLSKTSNRRLPEKCDSLRIYLRQGDFIVKSSENKVVIEASLAALSYPFKAKDPKGQGSFIFSNKTEVTIIGNLLVDYFYTEGSGGNSGLNAGGFFHIIHDPLIYDPAVSVSGVTQDPYHISIAPVKSLYSVNSGKGTF